MPILSVSTADNSSWFEDMVKESESKKQQPMTFQDDPVAMACAVHRSWKTEGTGQSLDLGSIPIESEDRDCAEAIRRYYGFKFTTMALTGQVLTDFRLKIGRSPRWASAIG